MEGTRRVGGAYWNMKREYRKVCDEKKRKKRKS